MDMICLKDLEKNAKFKKKLLSRNIWKNYAFVPPTGVLFISLFGIIYLHNHNLLISSYTIPFAGLFLLATIWLKATKKYLLEKKTLETQNFMVCESTLLSLNNNKKILMFCTDENRHNKQYLEKIKENIIQNADENNSELYTLTSNKKPKPFYNDNLYLTNLPESSCLSKKTKDYLSRDYKVIFAEPSQFNILDIKEIETILLKKQDKSKKFYIY